MMHSPIVHHGFISRAEKFAALVVLHVIAVALLLDYYPIATRMIRQRFAHDIALPTEPQLGCLVFDEPGTSARDGAAGLFYCATENGLISVWKVSK